MIPPDELKIESWPERKIGGQQVGMFIQGIKITHIPSGIIAISTNARSQMRNRDICMAMILEALTNPDLKL